MVLIPAGPFLMGSQSGARLLVREFSPGGISANTLSAYTAAPGRRPENAASAILADVEPGSPPRGKVTRGAEGFEETVVLGKFAAGHRRLILMAEPGGSGILWMLSPAHEMHSPGVRSHGPISLSVTAPVRCDRKRTSHFVHSQRTVARLLV